MLDNPTDSVKELARRRLEAIRAEKAKAEGTAEGKAAEAAKTSGEVAKLNPWKEVRQRALKVLVLFSAVFVAYLAYLVQPR